MHVGLPRCLSHFYLSPLYTTFLRGLGVEVLESAATSAKDLDLLYLCPTDEPCVSVKVAFCHARRLLDSGVDALFVPTVVSLSGTGYCCPKMMGLPAMLRAGLDLEPMRVVSPVIDMKDDPRCPGSPLPGPWA
jgi:predicted nucleotide-binding protein (sugar kinase/HSP70/actin superfamily)